VADGRRQRGGAAQSDDWRLVADRLFVYPAPNGLDGLCHLRVFECTRGRARPVVIVGGLTDEIGSRSITNSCEWIAAAVQEEYFPNGRRFDFVEHHPDQVSGEQTPTFALVRMARSGRARAWWRRRAASREPQGASTPTGHALVVVDKEGAASHRLDGPPTPPAWEFSAPRWESIEYQTMGAHRVALGPLPGVELRTWPRERYTAYSLAGEEGALMARGLGERNRRRADQLVGSAEAYSHAPADAVVDIGPDPQAPPA